MLYRPMAALVAALLSLSLLAGCAENPADNVPAAEVTDVETGAEGVAEDAAADDAEEASANDGDAMADEEAGNEVDEVDPDAPADDPAADMAEGEGMVLNGTIAAVGSKVTRSHYILFPEWTGTATLGDGSLEDAGVTIMIDTTALIADADDPGMMSERLQDHLLSADFFATEEFPVATFESTQIVEGGEGDATHTITGVLTIRGIAKEITFPATVTTGADGLAAQAEFAINRKDFAMEYAGQPDDLIRDEVVISLDVSTDSM